MAGLAVLDSASPTMLACMLGTLHGYSIIILLIRLNPEVKFAVFHPSHAIRAYKAPTNEDIFSTQYAVRSK